MDLLEFIAAQHSGSSFNPDNTSKALEIAAYVQRRPFAITKPGVAAIARLARHALGSSNGQGNSAEHQLWLLTSGALNTAAAICEFDGNAVAFFDAVKRDGVVRGKYVQRHYATAAMDEHVSDPNTYEESEDPDALVMRKMRALRPLQLAVAALLLVVAIFAGIIAGDQETQARVMNELVLPWFGYKSVPAPTGEQVSYVQAPAQTTPAH